MAALIGCLIGLGSLASNSELTIMRAAGVSIGRIVWAVMKPMLLLMLCSVLIGEYVAPPAETTAQANRALAQGSGDAQSAKHGLWHRQGDEFIHINAVQPGGLLIGVTRYTFDKERHMLSSSFAKRAQYSRRTMATDGHHHHDFRNVGQAPRPAPKWSICAKRSSRDMALKPELLNTVVMMPGTVVDLRAVGLYPLSQGPGLNNGRYWLAFWVKVLQPLVTAALVLMAISFIFGRSRLRDPGSAGVYRRAGGLHFPHRPGLARALPAWYSVSRRCLRCWCAGHLRLGRVLVAAPSRLIPLYRNNAPLPVGGACSRKSTKLAFIRISALSLLIFASKLAPT